MSYFATTSAVQSNMASSSLEHLRLGKSKGDERIVNDWVMTTKDGDRRGQDSHDREDLMLLMIMHVTQLQYIAWLENDPTTNAETLAKEETVLRQLRDRIRAMICLND